MENLYLVASAWYALGWIGCIIMEYIDYKEGNTTGLTLKLLVVYTLVSLFGGVLFVWCLGHMVTHLLKCVKWNTILIKYKVK